jgi:hypothetical protein
MARSAGDGAGVDRLPLVHGKASAAGLVLRANPAFRLLGGVMMTRAHAPSTYVEVDVRSPAHSGATLDEAFDAVADALHSMTLTPDADLAANSASHVLTFCLTFSGPVEPESALGASLEIARDAIGGAGLDAAAWEVVHTSVEPTGKPAPLLQTA